MLLSPRDDKAGSHNQALAGVHTPAMRGVPAAIEMRDVHLSLGSGASRVHILRGVSIEIEAGLAIGLVGPSGSGKSTLLMTAAGLERPDMGSVALRGRR